MNRCGDGADSSPNVWCHVGFGQVAAQSGSVLAAVRMVKPILQLRSQPCAQRRPSWLCHRWLGQLAAHIVWSLDADVYQKPAKTGSGEVVFSCQPPNSNRVRLC